jgi:hypothetical protein
MSTVDRLSGSLSSVAIKAPVRAATTGGNIGLFGLQTIDGVALCVGDRVLVKDQANAVENGIWVVRSSGWFRAADFNGSRDAVTGTEIGVVTGSVNGGQRFQISAPDPLIVGLSALSFQMMSQGPMGPAGPPGATGATGATGPQGPAGASGSGSGDVIGPETSADDHLALFEGPTGTQLKDGGIKGGLANRDTVSAAEIDDNAVSYAKLQNVSASGRLLGRRSAGAGDAEELSLHEVLELVGSAAQGDLLYRGGAAWTRLGAGSSGQFLQTQGAAADPHWATAATASLPPGHIFGLMLANAGSYGIEIAAGAARSSDNAADIVLAGALTKQLDAAWAAGSGNGGLDSGAKAAGATYHAYAIKRSDTGVVDALFSLKDDRRATVSLSIASPCVVGWAGHGLIAGSPVKFSTTGALPTGLAAGTSYFVIAAGLTSDTFRIAASVGGAAIDTSGSQSGVHTGQAAPLLPASYDKFRRIGSILTDGSGNIRAFVQNGDLFQWKSRPTASWNDVSSRTLIGVTVPAGLKLPALFTARMRENSGGGGGSGYRYALFTSPDENALAAATAPSLALAPVQVSDEFGAPISSTLEVAGQFEIITDNAGRIFYLTANSNDLVIDIATIGWRDARGRDGA